MGGSAGRGNRDRASPIRRAREEFPEILPLPDREGTEFAAPDALGRLGDRAARKAVAQLLPRGKERVRAAAVRRPGKLEAEEAAKALAGRLSGRGWERIEWGTGRVSRPVRRRDPIRAVDGGRPGDYGLR